MDQSLFQTVQIRGRAFGMDEHFAGAVEHRTSETQLLRHHINERPVTDTLNPAGDDDTAGGGIQTLANFWCGSQSSLWERAMRATGCLRW